MHNIIAGVTYPKRKLIEKTDKNLKYHFQLDTDKNIEISVEGISNHRFMFADNKEIIARKGISTLVCSIDGGITWSKEVEFKGFTIHQVYKLSNNNYLVGTLDSNEVSYIFLVDKDLTILSKNQLGSMCWHSQTAIDENKTVLMYAEYQNFSKEAQLPKDVSIFRSKDFGYTWDKVLSSSHPENTRHWHTLQADPFNEGYFIATSGDLPEQSKWFLTKDNGDNWSEITDESYYLEEVPNRSLSAHRTTTFLVTEDYYYFSTDDLMGSVFQYFLTKDSSRQNSSKFYRASKTEPIKVEKIANLGIHARSMIDTGKGILFITEAKYVSYNSQVFYVEKENLGKIYFLFNIYGNRRHSGSGSINSKLLTDSTFYTYTANKTFLDSSSQTLKWSINYAVNDRMIEYKIEEFIRFDEHLWFLNKINPIKNIYFYNNHVKTELNEKKDIFYLMLGDQNTHKLSPKQLFKMKKNDTKFTINISMNNLSDSTVNLFIQQFDEKNKISSKSYLLKKGNNKIDFTKETTADYLKLLIRVSTEGVGQIELYDLAIEKNNETLIDNNSSISKVLHKFETFTYEKEALSSEQFVVKFNQYMQHQLKIDNFNLDILSYFRKDNKKLVVFFNGAVNIEKTPLPVFQRWSWLEKLPYSSIIISDPTINEMSKQLNDDTYIGWYQGSSNNFILEKIVTNIENIIKKLDIIPENVVFYGSSAGGFASLIAASLLDGSKACVVNPQTDILEYYKKPVNKLLTYLKINKNETLGEKEKNFNVIKYFKYKKIFPHVFYKQNKLDEDHYLKHYIYFNNEYCRLEHKKKLYAVLSSDEKGHSAIPLFEETLKDIEKTFEVFSNKKINIDFFGLVKNESILYDFKPRKDLPLYKLVFPIDWRIDPFNDRNWCFQLHAWRMIDVLLIEYENSGAIEKIIKSLEIITDWERFTIEDKNEIFYTWYDMSTGLRALKLAYILNRISENAISEKINKTQKNILLTLAKIHIDKLKSQKVSQNNHGIFQIHGLLMLAWQFSDHENIDYALTQMKTLVKQQFYEDGFHVENSDEYHWFAFKIFNDFMHFEAYKNINSIQEVMQKAQDCKKWTVFPNRRSLMIGDSGDTNQKIDIGYINNSSIIMKFFKDSGFLFIRSAFKTKAEDSSMLFLQTAYKNNTHRHSDDFNMLLYEYGLNILVDAGKHSYEYHSDSRQYVVSTKAHNTVMMDNKDYNLKDKEFYESALEYCNENNGIYEIKTTLYREKLEVTHSRIIVYKPKEFCIVIDKLDSDKERRYDQFWHFHQDLELVKSESGFTTDINDKISMLVEPSIVNLDKEIIILGNDKIDTRLMKGQTEPELQGWRSLKYKELVENYALQNSIEAKKALLITKFIFSNDTVSKPDLNIDIIKEKDKLYCNIESNIFKIETTIDL